MSGLMLLAGDQCQVHKTHRPAVHETVVHHVMPKGMGGPDVPANRVNICPTGHANVHRAIRALIDGTTPTGSRSELVLARVGYQQWLDAGRPGRPE